ncbi:hypothetical protein ACRE_037050 [Hapsidospora chrysogenum ATCC 11550]|uniref:Uncharacterized protein n=1 Tax=Hapsidospora chrysogenum (strain ATCC 11550 / CBS 779.69 / DSM 880 / IAM 14645 / JCM 23072 / IMI 49137) TaxID=857340 RepID=A0A086T828_HAPC1|nr:hypothetical protein ACRE_037050 [Hapsidospora chrysogenum ATCC 11550]
MVIPADRISREEFGELLARYPAVLDSISSSKGGTSALFCAPTVKAARRANDAVGLLAGIMANPSTLAVKDGQKPLSELDAYRYEEAPTLFASDESKRQMDLDAIKILVEWKL